MSMIGKSFELDKKNSKIVVDSLNQEPTPIYELKDDGTSEGFARDKYEALYLINNGLCDKPGFEKSWNYRCYNDCQYYSIMTARQYDNFSKVEICVDDITIYNGEESNHESTYDWDELPYDYVKFINKWYHTYHDNGTMNHRNYDSIVQYARMVKFFIENNYDIEVDCYGGFTLNLPMREKLTDYSRDIRISNDGTGYMISSEIRHRTDSFSQKLFDVRLNDITDMISKAKAYDDLKKSLVPFMTKSLY